MFGALASRWCGARERMRHRRSRGSGRVAADASGGRVGCGRDRGNGTSMVPATTTWGPCIPLDRICASSFSTVTERLISARLPVRMARVAVREFWPHSCCLASCHRTTASRNSPLASATPARTISESADRWSMQACRDRNSASSRSPSSIAMRDCRRRRAARSSMVMIRLRSVPHR